MPPFQPHDITVEISQSPQTAKRRIKTLIDKHSSLQDVADELGVSYRSLHRYLTKLGIREKKR